MTSSVLITKALLRDMPLPGLPEESDKDARGRVFVIAGGAAVPGAPILTGLASLRIGAGKLKLAAPFSHVLGLGLATPEARIVGVSADDVGEIGMAACAALAAHVDSSDAVVIGPGMLSHDASALAVALCRGKATFVLDAGAMDGLIGLASELRPVAGRLVLTPHAGEMANLLGWDKDRVLAQPDVAARTAASHLGAVVALKGQTTLIASPDGRLWRHEGGVNGLGTSGSGDVLAGFIGGLLARGATPAQATVWGVFVHGRVGRKLTDAVGPLGFLAREILDVAPQVLDELA